MWDFLQTSACCLRGHVSTENTASFAAKKNECEVYFSSMHAMKVPVHKIQSCFAICAVDFANYSCLTWTQMKQFFAFHANDAGKTILCLIFLVVSNLAPFYTVFLYLPRVFSLYS
jgi:hypothetical protein